MAASEGRETEHGEIIRRSFEYVDADGETLGSAEIELEGPEVDVEYKTAKGAPGKGRKLRSFILRGEKDGKPTDVDMMALANKHGVTVVSSTENLENYHFDDGKDLALVPPLETPLDVGVFLHELGHADQHHEDRFRKIAPLYGRSKSAASGEGTLSYPALSELLEAVVEAVPDAAKALDTDELEQLRRLEDRRQDELSRKARFERSLDEQLVFRSGELQDFLSAAMEDKGLDLGKLLEECKETADDERHVFPPLVASPRVAALVAKLEDAGVMFQERYRDEGLDRKQWRPEDLRFPSERELPAAPLSALSITTGDQAKSVLEAIMEAKAHETELLYDVAAEELVMRLKFLPAGGQAAEGQPGVTKRSFGQARVLAVRVGVDHDAFERYAGQRENADRQVRLLEEKTDAAWRDAQKTAELQQLLIRELAIDDIAALPTRMMERDATRRALQWLRSVRQRAGIDLLAPHRVSRESLASSGGGTGTDCLGATQHGIEAGDEAVEATVVADLKRALTSYGADRPLRSPDGGHGFRPIARDAPDEPAGEGPSQAT
jgi:hypothetical protein